MTVPIEFRLRGEHITLDALLKATGLAESGGRAKAMVAAGLVQVDGQQELRKTCKLRAGQVVALQGMSVRIQAAPPDAPAADEGR
jgi:ribosome-associated protein